MSADQRVTRSSFANHIKPISVRHPMVSLPHRVWSQRDWERIQLGFHSHGMDERWNVFAEGDTVFLHRSWTGFGIFEATFAPAESEGWRIAEAVVERDRERFRLADSEYDRLLLELVLSTIVLNEPAPELRAEFRSHLNQTNPA
jgi:hypothetical protein